MRLIKYLKSIVSEHLSTVNMLNSLKTCTTALPSYYFMILAKIYVENVRVSVSEMLGVFVNTLTADEEYSLRNRTTYRNQFDSNYLRNEQVF